MTYQSSENPEFVLNRFFFGVGCRLKIGTGLPLGQACVLVPAGDKPLEEWNEALCLP
jgi:hypothetical protein